ncbi:hypothetical protein [Vagococcus lutrae]|uniref:hypothetical protein n=1 Tax=Vagococcus lutrae TaxID=81947 RepID=UPI00288E926B|nr:hypothetical protein [Vagococcus lutrae]MDT2807371.1 hypothetical protein [Vagococcus lutrae]
MTAQVHHLDIHFMKDALELAKTAAAEGNEPFGALLVKNQHIVTSLLREKIIFILKATQPITLN